MPSRRHGLGDRPRDRSRASDGVGCRRARPTNTDGASPSARTTTWRPGPGDGHVEHPALALLVVAQPVGEQPGGRAEDDDPAPLPALDPVDGREQHRRAGGARGPGQDLRSQASKVAASGWRAATDSRATRSSACVERSASRRDESRTSMVSPSPIPTLIVRSASARRPGGTPRPRRRCRRRSARTFGTSRPDSRPASRRISARPTWSAPFVTMSTTMGAMPRDGRRIVSAMSWRRIRPGSAPIRR